MTGISKESVDEIASSLDKSYLKVNGTHSMEASVLRALSARIAELEAERDADMRDLIKVEVITRIQQQAREDALNEAADVGFSQSDGYNRRSVKRDILALIDKEPKP